jgi:hypothetical protein
MMQLATLVKANMILARTRREPVTAGVGFFDIKGGLNKVGGDLKQSFPTFTKILSHTGAKGNPEEILSTRG